MFAITKVYNHFFLNLKGSCPFSDDVSNGVKQRETMLDIKESNWQPKPNDYMMSLAFDLAGWATGESKCWVVVLVLLLLTCNCLITKTRLHIWCIYQHLVPPRIYIELLEIFNRRSETGSLEEVHHQSPQDGIIFFKRKGKTVCMEHLSDSKLEVRTKLKD